MGGKVKKSVQKTKNVSCDEIDAVFAEIKSKPIPIKLENFVKKKSSKQQDIKRFGDPQGKLTEGAARRFTDDGLPIYAWDEIISKD